MKQFPEVMLTTWKAFLICIINIISKYNINIAVKQLILIMT